MEQANLLLEGKYEILAKIREGGMGTIYKVRHRLLDEIRVIKVMRASTVSDADLKRRFLEEARTAIRLKHPNICAIYDFAADDNGTAYLVMEYIDGITLAELLKSGGLPAVPLTLQIAHQGLCALGYLHRRGVIHRDVAPDNLMLTYDEEHRVVVKLIDLGIAKIVDRELDLTATGVFLGKPKYASPEQFGTLSPGERLDGRSDLYGLGVVLYELLTGIRPYAGKSPIEILRAQHLNLLIPFEESDPMGRVSPLLRAIVFKALQREREDRFATADEFDRELMRLLDPNAAPHDHAVSPAVLSTIRDAQPKASDTPTPSAQDRLNKHFGVQATPLPSAPLMTVVPHASPEDDADGLHTVRLAMPPRTPAASEAPFVIESSASSPFLDQTAISPLSSLEAASSEAEEEPLREIPPIVAAPAKPSPLSMWIPGPMTASPILIPPPVTMVSPSPMMPATVVAPVAVTVTSPLNFTASPSVFPEPVSIAKRPEASREVTLAREQRPAPTDPYLPQATRESLHFQGIGPSRSLVIPLVAAAAIAAAALLIWHPWSRRSAPPPVATNAAPREETQPLPNVEVAPPQSQNAGVPEAPRADSIAATSPSSAAPAAGAAPAESEEIARASAAVAAARKDADDVRGSDFAPTRYRKANAKQTAAAEAVTRGRTAEAKVLLEEALSLYTQAATIARNQEHPTLYVDSNPKPAAPKPAPPPPNTAPPAASETLDPAAAEAARKEINRVVGDYAWARHTRNEKLFAQVFPSDIATFRQESRRFEIEDVRIDVQSISFEGARAVVAANEVVIGTPHDGENVRTESRVVLDLQKSGGHWVIAARR